MCLLLVSLSLILAWQLLRARLPRTRLNKGIWRRAGALLRGLKRG
jgi:hypothetical protein